MKVFPIFRGISLMAALLSTPSAMAAREIVPMTAKAMIRIPYGDSSWNFQLDRVYNLNPLQLRYTLGRSCSVSPPLALQVHYKDDPAWYGTSFEQNGYFRHKGGNLDGVRVNFRQRQAPELICEMQLFGVTTDQPTPPTPPPTTPPPAGEPEYAGVVTYAGGYLHRSVVTLKQPVNARLFQIKVPEFCGRVEVIEAGTIQGNERFVAARAAGATGTLADRVYAFDSVLPLTNLVVSINGPKDLSCDIPLYLLVQP